MKALNDAGIPIVTASPQFVAEIKSRTAKLEQAWADKAKAKGLDGSGRARGVARRDRQADKLVSEGDTSRHPVRRVPRHGHPGGA